MDMYQPVATIQIEVYENSEKFIGVAKVTLPEITHPTISIAASGMMGGLDVPLIGMINSMKATLQFLDGNNPTSMVKLLSSGAHQLDLRAPNQWWDMQTVNSGLWADRYLLLGRTISFNQGEIAPFTQQNATVQMEIYRYAAYRGAATVFDIDKRIQKFEVNGVDYFAPVKAALGG